MPWNKIDQQIFHPELFGTSFIKPLTEIHVYPPMHVQVSLKSLVESRQRMVATLSQPVGSLEQLRDTLTLLLEIEDLQTSIDELYSPVENIYSLLKSVDYIVLRNY